MQIEFKEQQQFRQWWLALMFVIIGLIPIFSIYKQFILKEPFGNKAMSSDGGVILMAVLIYAIIALVWSIRLKTEINQYEIKMSLFPFIQKIHNKFFKK